MPKHLDWRDKFGAKKDQAELDITTDSSSGERIVVTDRGTFKQAVAPKGPVPEIFKVQRPITTMEAEPKILVYNQSRTWEGILPYTKDWDLLFGDKHKVYVIATPDPINGLLDISHVISDQDW